MMGIALRSTILAHTRGTVRRGPRTMIMMALAVIATGCGSDTAGPALGSVVPKLTLNHHAVTLALRSPGYDTIRLVASVHTNLGAPIADVGPITYTPPVGDTSVLVSANGLLTAHAPTSGIKVVATTTVDGVTVGDTVLVAVNDLGGSTPSPFTTLAMTFASGSSTGAHCGENVGDPATPGVVLAVTAFDAAHNPIPNVVVAFRSSDTGRVTVASQPAFDDGGNLAGVNGVVTPMCASVGPVWISVNSTIYGVTREDSVRITLGAPRQLVVLRFPATEEFPDRFALLDGNADLRTGPVTIEAGATVIWVNSAKTPLDIVFDAPANVLEANPVTILGFVPVPPNGAGNIALSDADSTNIFSPANIHSRRFPIPGTYYFHTTQSSAMGTIDVVPPPS